MKRFWDKVNKKGTVIRKELGHCWEWTAAKAQGYGTFSMGRKRSHIIASRFSWELTHGEIPKEFVLHRCDNPACVRPNHLYLGNQKDNMADCSRKGRAKGRLTGVKHNPLAAKITAKDVKEIRKKYSTGLYSQREIGEQYGIKQSQVSTIILNKNWSHV